MSKNPAKEIMLGFKEERKNRAVTHIKEFLLPKYHTWKELFDKDTKEYNIISVNKNFTIFS